MTRRRLSPRMLRLIREYTKEPPEFLPDFLPNCPNPSCERLYPCGCPGQEDEALRRKFLASERGAGAIAAAPSVPLSGVEPETPLGLPSPAPLFTHRDRRPPHEPPQVSATGGRRS